MHMCMCPEDTKSKSSVISPAVPKKLIEIDWDGHDSDLLKTLDLNWSCYKNSFLRCLNVLTKNTMTYPELTLMSGAGVYFRWKEASNDDYSNMRDVNQQIQSIQRDSSLQFEQVRIDDWKISYSTDVDLLTDHIYKLEKRIVDSLNNQSLILTHDENGHFGILCGYKDLTQLKHDLKFLEKPAHFVFLLRNFVSNEDVANQYPEQAWSHVTVVSRKYIIFVTTKQNSAASNKNKILLLKDALQAAIQVYRGKENKRQQKTPTNFHPNSNHKQEWKTNNTNNSKVSKHETSKNLLISINESKTDETVKIEESASVSRDIDTAFNLEAEGQPGFQMWIEHLSKQPMTNQSYTLTLHCLMMFYDARSSLQKYLADLVIDSNSKFSAALKNAIFILNKQTTLILKCEECQMNIQTFRGIFADFTLSDKITVQERDNRRKELLSLVQNIASLEPDIFQSFEDIVEVSSTQLS
ncbi:hypothetical protein RFI_27187 [Reticulomyxa filosa]|uniref:Uncharacterized protein n=1 Tax=Reticulomyxa filosa TaxID=46433 RepID=X6MAX4_RETFI|nr:hypothetical protein RFI_27187 [Reticulomyxa filosa]|eukprot:ETO10190.1 hypothetical protein RFI_27187 [Reticulomyxa filosa]